jgi:hypothetical protein
VELLAPLIFSYPCITICECPSSSELSSSTLSPYAVNCLFTEGWLGDLDLDLHSSDGGWGEVDLSF